MLFISADHGAQSQMQMLLEGSNRCRALQAHSAAEAVEVSLAESPTLVLLDALVTDMPVAQLVEKL